MPKKILPRNFGQVGLKHGPIKSDVQDVLYTDNSITWLITEFIFLYGTMYLFKAILKTEFITVRIAVPNVSEPRKSFNIAEKPMTLYLFIVDIVPKGSKPITV